MNTLLTIYCSKAQIKRKWLIFKALMPKNIWTKLKHSINNNDMVHCGAVSVPAHENFIAKKTRYSLIILDRYLVWKKYVKMVTIPKYFC